MNNRRCAFRRMAAFSHKAWWRLSIGAVLSIAFLGSVGAVEIESNIARGGMLYDKWYEVIEQGKPEKSHPAYPADKKYAEKPGSNLRCKECHGWDYMGKDGAYAGGKHFTGISGIQGMKGAETTQIISVLKNDTHQYAEKMSEEDFYDLAFFISKGQIEMDQYIDRKSKSPKGIYATNGIS